MLCLSTAEPRPVVGVDIGEGVILRYDEEHRQVVGLTRTSLRARLAKKLAEAA